MPVFFKILPPSKKKNVAVVYRLAILQILRYIILSTDIYSLERFSTADFAKFSFSTKFKSTPHIEKSFSPVIDKIKFPIKRTDLKIAKQESSFFWWSFQKTANSFFLQAPKKTKQNNKKKNKSYLQLVNLHFFPFFGRNW